jgi:hypothetical protein
LNADGGIDAEPAGALPGEHALGISLIEQSLRTEVPEHAALNDTLELEPVAFVERCRLVEAGGSVGDLSEDAVEDHDVEVEVGVESRPEAVLFRMSECRIPLVLTTDGYTAWWIQHRFRRTRKEFAAARQAKGSP